MAKAKKQKSPCAPREGICGSRGIAPLLHKLGTTWRCDQLHDPAALPPAKYPPPSPSGIHWVGGLMGLITCLNVTEKKKCLAPAWNRTRGRTLVTAFTTLYRAVLGQRSGVSS